MPLMFIPAATGLMTSWGIIRAKLFAYLAIAVITTVLVMVVSARHVSSSCAAAGGAWNFLNTPSFSAFRSACLPTGSAWCCKKRFRLALFNPLLLVIVTILVLVTAHIDYRCLRRGEYLSYLLTPTVCLAVPLYENSHCCAAAGGPSRRYPPFTTLSACWH